MKSSPVIAETGAVIAVFSDDETTDEGTGNTSSNEDADGIPAESDDESFRSSWPSPPFSGSFLLARSLLLLTRLAFQQV